jgi:hypothetical protein
MKLLSWLAYSVVFTSWASAQSLDEGVALFNKGKTGEAKSIFESVLKQNDNSGEAHFRLGLIFLMRQFRNEDDAVDHMERAVESTVWAPHTEPRRRTQASSSRPCWPLR